MRQLKSDVQRKAILGMRAFFTTATKFMQTRLPLSNKLLKHLSCLDPKKKAIGEHSHSIGYIAKMFNMSAEHLDKVADEWTLYSIEKVPESLVTAAKDKPVRVDHYWREMLSITTAVGEPKYPFLSVLVKTALVLPH